MCQDNLPASGSSAFGFLLKNNNNNDIVLVHIPNPNKMRINVNPSVSSTLVSRYVFTIVSYLIGVFIFATIVGQVGNVITNRNANRLEFERLLDGAKTYMRHHKVNVNRRRKTPLLPLMTLPDNCHVTDAIPPFLHSSLHRFRAG